MSRSLVGVRWLVLGARSVASSDHRTLTSDLSHQICHSAPNSDHWTPTSDLSHRICRTYYFILVHQHRLWRVWAADAGECVPHGGVCIDCQHGGEMQKEQVAPGEPKPKHQAGEHQAADADTMQEKSKEVGQLVYMLVGLPFLCVTPFASSVLQFIFCRVFDCAGPIGIDGGYYSQCPRQSSLVGVWQLVLAVCVRVRA